MLWRARKLLITLILSAKKYGGLSLKKGEGRVRVEGGSWVKHLMFNIKGVK